MKLYAGLSNGQKVELAVASGLDLETLTPRELGEAVAEAGAWVATVDDRPWIHSACVRRDSIIGLEILRDEDETRDPSPPPPPPRPATPTLS